MERVSARSVPACPTLFTPLQIHVRELLRFGVVSWVGWMRDHTISLQRMIEEHGCAVVVAGASLSYSGTRLFHDGDTIDIATTSSVHRNGVLIEGASRFSSEGKQFAEMKIYFRPVTIGDEHSAAARPSNLSPALQALFAENEIAPVAYPRNVKKLLPLVTGQGVKLAQGRHPFKLFRYAMDFADQWAFMETSAYCSTSREELVLANAGVNARLMDGLSAPVIQFHVDLTKPYFVFDSGTVDTSAYLLGEDLYFVHRLLGEVHGDEQVHATVIELMGRPLH